MEEVTRYDVFTTNKGQMHEFTIPFYLDRLSKSSFHKPTPEHNPPECLKSDKAYFKTVQFQASWIRLPNDALFI